MNNSLIIILKYSIEKHKTRLRRLENVYIDREKERKRVLEKLCHVFTDTALFPVTISTVFPRISFLNDQFFLEYE